MNLEPVINASPLIFLAKADCLELLLCLHNSILVPQKVWEEIKAKPEDRRSLSALENYAWLRVVDTGAIPSVIQAWDLGEGESSVLTWTLAHPGTEAIIDDLAGRRCAKALGVSLRGTLGLVLFARAQGRIPQARPVIEQLLAHGMYLSEQVINQALALVGE